MTKTERGYMRELDDYDGVVEHVYHVRQQEAHNLTIRDFDGVCECRPVFEMDWPNLVVVHQRLAEA
mgnify:CR=1 FL=1